MEYKRTERVGPRMVGLEHHALEDSELNSALEFNKFIILKIKTITDSKNNPLIFKSVEQLAPIHTTLALDNKRGAIEFVVKTSPDSFPDFKVEFERQLNFLSMGGSGFEINKTLLALEKDVNNSSLFLITAFWEIGDRNRFPSNTRLRLTDSIILEDDDSLIDNDNLLVISNLLPGKQASEPVENFRIFGIGMSIHSGGDCSTDCKYTSYIFNQYSGDIAVHVSGKVKTYKDGNTGFLSSNMRTDLIPEGKSELLENKKKMKTGMKKVERLLNRYHTLHHKRVKIGHKMSADSEFNLISLLTAALALL